MFNTNVLMFFLLGVITLTTINTYLYATIPKDSPELSSTSQGMDTSNNNDNESVDPRSQDSSSNGEMDDSSISSDVAEFKEESPQIPAFSAQETGLLGSVPPDGDQQEAEEKKVCVTNKDGVKFCFEKLPPDERPCPEPIEAEDPPLNPDVCLPPKEGIDNGSIPDINTSDLIKQNGFDNNSTAGDIVIKEEGTTSSPCIIIKEEGTSSGSSGPKPQQPNQPTPSPKPC